MANHEASRLLELHQLRKTIIRTRVLEIFLDQREALAQHDIESHIGEVDRITLYRTLRTFEDKGLIHRAIDGSDKAKYALCHSDCTEHEHFDNHAHFNCESCGKTLCLDTVESPVVDAPPGFQIRSTHLVVQGRCEKCSEE